MCASEESSNNGRKARPFGCIRQKGHFANKPPFAGTGFLSLLAKHCCLQKRFSKSHFVRRATGLQRAAFCCKHAPFFTESDLLCIYVARHASFVAKQAFIQNRRFAGHYLQTATFASSCQNPPQTIFCEALFMRSDTVCTKYLFGKGCFSNIAVLCRKTSPCSS